MRDAASKVMARIGPGQRNRWLVVVVMAAAVSVAEAASTLPAFALLGQQAGDAAGMELRLVGDVRGMLPWQGMHLLVVVGIATAVLFMVRRD